MTVDDQIGILLASKAGKMIRETVPSGESWIVAKDSSFDFKTNRYNVETNILDAKACITISELMSRGASHIKFKNGNICTLLAFFSEDNQFLVYGTRYFIREAVQEGIKWTSNLHCDAPEWNSFEVAVR